MKLMLPVLAIVLVGILVAGRSGGVSAVSAPTRDGGTLPKGHPPVSWQQPGLPDGHPPLPEWHPPLPDGHPACPRGQSGQSRTPGGDPGLTAVAPSIIST